MSKKTLLLSSAILASLNLNAASLQWSPELIQGELDNGFGYVAYSSPNANEPFNLRLIVNAGSIDDEQRGMAHIVEHMVFRGNRAHEIDMHRLFDQIGWQTGKQINAMTRQTETQYMLRTRPNDSLNLNQSIELLSDLAFGAKMLDKEWQIERDVILEEMRKGAGVAERINNEKKEVVRNGSRYTDRPTIGTKEDVKAVSIEQIRDFYQRFYVPGNMTLVASGHFDKDLFEKAINEHFGVQKKMPVPERDYVKLPLKAGLVIDKVQDEKGTSSAVVYGFRSELKPSVSEEGAYQRLENYFLRNLVRNSVLASKDIHKDKASSVSITFSEPTNERLIVAIRARTDDHDAGLDIVLTEIERLRQNGIEQGALDALKAKAKAAVERNREIIPKRDFTRWEDKLTSAVMQDSVEEDYAVKSARNLKWVDEITVESLNARLRTLLSSPDQFMFYQIPGGIEKALPSKDSVQLLASNIAQTKLDKIEAKAKEKSVEESNKLETTKVKKDNIVLPELKLDAAEVISKHHYYSANVVQWKLANGDNVVWLNKETPKNELYIKALSKAGYQRTEQAPWLLQSAQQIWQQSDYDAFTNEELQQWQVQNKANWSWSQKSTELDLSAKVSSQNLPALMQAYTFIHQNWQLKDNAFEQIQANLQSLVKTASIDEMVRSRLWGQEQNTAPTQKELDALTLAGLTSSIEQLSKQPVSLYIVGKSTENEIVTHVLPYLNAIERKKQDPLSFSSLSVGKHIISQPMHDENKSTVTIKAESDLAWSPEASFLVSTLNPIVQKALKNKLRHELGGLYSLRYEMSLDKDNKVRMSTSFTTAPEKVQLLIKAHDEVLANLSTQLDNENYQRIQEDIRFAESLRLQDPSTWLRRLALSFEKYQQPDYLDSMLTLEKQVTKDKMQHFVDAIMPVSHQAILIGTPKH